MDFSFQRLRTTDEDLKTLKTVQTKNVMKQQVYPKICTCFLFRLFHNTICNTFFLATVSSIKANNLTKMDSSYFPCAVFKYCKYSYG